MHRSCKDIDIKDANTVLPWVTDCVNRHKKRHDFRNLLARHGLSRDLYYQIMRSDKLMTLGVPKEDMDQFLAHRKKIYESYYRAIKSIAADACERIRKRELDLRPVIIREREDKASGKMRLIGNELAMQQVFDYIAVGAADGIFNRRIVPQQASSIQGRGQIYGKEIIRRTLNKDNRSAEYAKRHGLRYTRKCRYHVKLDIKKCYNNAKLEIFLSLFRRDCKNEDLLWLWEVLLRSHRVNGYTGFMIGALPSQWGCQYMLSFAYRYVMDLHKQRRGKLIKMASSMVMFMDDTTIFSASRKNLKSVVSLLTGFLKGVLGFDVKPGWHIRDTLKTGVDMMGYVMHYNGKVSIRGRDFVRARRMALRCTSGSEVSVKQAQRMMSYKGYFDNTDSRKADQKYSLKTVYRFCSRLIGAYNRMINELLKGAITHDYLQCQIQC